MAGMEIFLSYVIPLLVLVNLVVLIHSGGHFIVARWVGVEIEIVSLGLGPTLFRFSGIGASWKVCLLPIGGYVRAKYGGDAAFNKEIATALAGPFSSLAFSVIVVFIIVSMQGIPAVYEGQVVLVQQSFADDLLVTIRTIYLSWTKWSSDSWGAIASIYEPAAARLMLLTAIVSSKLGILNLLPIPKSDGWKICHQILRRIFGSIKSGTTMKWLFRGEVAIAVVFVLYLTWSDLVHLSIIP